MISQQLPLTISQELADRVKALRLRKEWSREALAASSNVNVYSLKRFERTGQISLERFLSICAALGVASEFDRLLKPRERVSIEDWTIPKKTTRQRGRRRVKMQRESSPV